MGVGLRLGLGGLGLGLGLGVGLGLGLGLAHLHPIPNPNPNLERYVPPAGVPLALRRRALRAHLLGRPSREQLVSACGFRGRVRL